MACIAKITGNRVIGMTPMVAEPTSAAANETLQA